MIRTVSGEKRIEITILAADLVGFTELIYRDTRAGVDILKESRAILAAALEENGATILQTAGDFLLASFRAEDDALLAALLAQEALLRYHLETPHGKAGHWKIGLAHGEVFVISGEHFGNAVNIAARLQALAAPGEVWLSDTIHRSKTLPAQFALQNVGAKHLKNIDTSVRVYRAYLPDYSRCIPPADVQEAPVLPKTLANLRKPVLRLEPFVPLNTRGKAKFFGKALVDEVQLILSRLSHSITVSSSAAIAKGQSDFTLIGSIQSAGPHMRITASLLSTADGILYWGERFDCDLRKPFDMQDRIAREIVTALQLALTEGEQAQLWHRGTASGQAWEAFQRGRDLERRYMRHSHVRAREFYQDAIAIDHDYLSAIVALAFCHLDDVRLGWSSDIDASLSLAEETFQQAQKLSPKHPDVLSLMAFLRFFQGKPEDAKTAMARAVALAPQSPELVAYQGALLDLLGDYEGAVTAYTRALALTPYAPIWIAANFGLSLLALNRIFEAERVYRQIIRHYPEFVRAWIGLTVVLVRQGKMRDAARAADTVMSLDPHFAVSDWGSSRPFPDEETLHAFESDLRAAGLK